MYCFRSFPPANPAGRQLGEALFSLQLVAAPEGCFCTTGARYGKVCWRGYEVTHLPLDVVCVNPAFMLLADTAVLNHLRARMHVLRE